MIENDEILRHDCIWPHGLNLSLHIDSQLEIAEFRRSCVRHSWPPASDDVTGDIDLPQLRKKVRAISRRESETEL